MSAGLIRARGRKSGSIGRNKNMTFVYLLKWTFEHWLSTLAVYQAPF